MINYIMMLISKLIGKVLVFIKDIIKPDVLHS
jgi:hypothetical protein